MTEACHFSLKQASKYNTDRNYDGNSERTLLLRQDIVRKWKEAGIDFQKKKKNCDFIDEAGFHTQMMGSRAWSKNVIPLLYKFIADVGKCYDCRMYFSIWKHQLF